MNEHLIQTGRTTRLMGQAQELTDMGHRVTLLVHDSRYRTLVEREARRRCYTFTVAVVPEHFDWAKMEPRERRDSTTKWLVDHAAIELELQKLDEHILKCQQLVRQLYHLTT